MLHIWSDIPNHKALGVLPKSSMVHSAHEHAKKGERYLGANSLKELEGIFARYKEQNKKIDKLDFHTHGHAGGLNIGREVLNIRTLDRFQNKGFDQIFRPGARVFFQGCNVAEKAIGECFLARFGEIFLNSGGGRAGGSTSVGLTDLIFRTGKTYHFSGSTVYAHVSPGGRVTLQNARHLNVRHIERQVVAASTKAIPVLMKITGGTRPSRRPLLDQARMQLAKASASLSSAKTSSAPYRHLYNAHYYLDQAVKPLRMFLRTLDSRELVYVQLNRFAFVP